MLYCVLWKEYFTKSFYWIVTYQFNVKKKKSVRFFSISSFPSFTIKQAQPLRCKGYTRSGCFRFSPSSVHDIKESCLYLLSMNIHDTETLGWFFNSHQKPVISLPQLFTLIIQGHLFSESRELSVCSLVSGRTQRPLFRL